MMKLEDFDYDLPAELIAQEPCVRRDASRMMVLGKKTQDIEESVFHELPRYLEEGDVIVVNDSKVIPARLRGKKATGSVIEILLLTRIAQDNDSQIWEVLLRPAKRVKAGDIIDFHGICEGRIRERVDEKKWIVRFQSDAPFDDFLDRYGAAPLPPYIKRKDKTDDTLSDRARYQTIYARIPGSVAAPTAGFHFSPEVLNTLKSKGIQIVPVTLHVGYGTFVPIETEHIEDHRMEQEYFEIGPEAAAVINAAKRVVAVGTTSTRVLESAADEDGKVIPMSASTRLYIYPGYRFKRVNALITNFHLPKSSLYLLVCAFAGKPLIESAYRRAISGGFRFYSYGDCMLIK